MKPGLYVYGIVDAGALDAPPRATGVDPDRGPFLFETDALTAIVSEVDVTEFEGDALERNVSSADWLEAKVRGHESVLDEVVATTTVVPMRFGSIFSAPDGLGAMLDEHAQPLKESLDRVRGRSEWGVKIHCDQRALIGQLAGSVTGPPSGRDYLMQKKALLDAQAQAADAAAAVSNQVHVSLAAAADDATSMPLRGRDAHSTVVHNGAYLVPNEDRGTFMKLVDDVQKAHADAYLFEVTGPWPPYNFTSADVAGPRS